MCPLFSPNSVIGGYSNLSTHIVLKFQTRFEVYQLFKNSILNLKSNVCLDLRKCFSSFIFIDFSGCDELNTDSKL